MNVGQIYCDCVCLIEESQTGFHKGYSTTDNVFVLSNLIEYMLHKGRKLYSAFIEFGKVFDRVWRNGLWLKLVRSGIKGKCFKVICNMYFESKSCVSVNNV